MSRISVIIPTLNEAANLPQAIAALRSQGECEIIVVDGGSRDETQLAAKDSDRVLVSPRGRARQMNVGARHATGGFLLFLHADCILAPGALDAMRLALNRDSVSAACFSMRVQAQAVPYRSIDWCATARVRLTGIIYGDQGLAVRRDTFERIGGFPEVRFMEDVLISQRLRQLGRVIVLPQKIYVSARRWQKHGIVRQTLRNWSLTALAMAGVHPDRLAAYYAAQS